MNTKIGALIVGGLAAFAYYKYNKLSPKEKKDIVDNLKREGKKLYEEYIPVVKDKIERVSFKLNEVAHTFLKGHQVMVQVQSSWFPLVDRNPQKFVNIFKAEESDFQKATIRVFTDAANSSNVVLPVMGK